MVQGSTAQSPVKYQLPRTSVLGSHSTADISWPWYTLGLIQRVSFWILCAWVQTHETRSFVPKDFLLRCWQPPPLLSFFFFFLSNELFSKIFLVFKPYLSVLSFSRCHVAHKYLFRTKLIDEFKYWEKKKFQIHDLCPQKNLQLSHITEWKGGRHEPNIQSVEQGPVNSGWASQGIFSGRFELGFDD